MDAFNPNIVAVQQPCGAYYFCVDPGTQVNPLFSLTSYFPLELATLQGVNTSDLIDADGFGLFCVIAFDYVLSDVTPPFDPTQGMVGIQVNQDGSACTPDGWSFTLYDSDGGVYDAPVAYLSGSAGMQGDGGTSGEGIAFFYNLDVNRGPVTFVPQRNGMMCSSASTLPGNWFTGEIPLRAGTISLFILALE
jgi:hypothetical protein